MESNKPTSLIIPDNFPMYGVTLAGTRWEWVQHDSSPIEPSSLAIDWSSALKPPTIMWADWMKEKDAFCRRAGVYIWTIELQDGGRRFIHVGKAGHGKTTSMWQRTKCHCRHQFKKGRHRDHLCTHDRIHRVVKTDDEFGSLGNALWDGTPENSAEMDTLEGTEERALAAIEFLKQVRIVYLSPTDTNSDGLINSLESIVGRAAAELMSLTGINSKISDETTNTLNGGMTTKLSDEECEAVANTLNRIYPMLPVKKRFRKTR